MTRITPVFLLFVSVGCATDAYDTASDTITGACVYTAEDGAAWCVNQWAGEESCPTEDSGATSGEWSTGASCEGLGYAYPCTYDAPSSAWVAEDGQCAAWGL